MIFSEIPYDNLNNKLDLYVSNDECDKIFIYFHGGGFSFGDKKWMNRRAHFFLDQNIAVASVNYRLYPQAKYPDYVIDAITSVIYIQNNFKQFKHIYIGGSSAGGYLVEMIAFNHELTEKFGFNPNSIDGYFIDAGETYTHFAVLKERGIDETKEVLDEASPLYHLDKLLDHPKFYLLNAEFDMLNRVKHVNELMQKMKTLGYQKIEYKKMIGYKHCEYCNEPIYFEIITKFILA